MTPEQLTTLSSLARAATPGPYVLELKERFPYGVRIIAGDTIIVSADAPAFSTKQRSRADNDVALGFPHNERVGIVKRIAEQTATAQLIAALSPDVVLELIEMAWRAGPIADVMIEGTK